MRNINSKKRAALLTGVSRKKSIGYGIANRLASDGLNLFLQSFTEYDKMMIPNYSSSELKIIYESLKKHNIQIEQMDIDLNIPDSSERLYEAALTRFKHIDVLIINHTYDTRISISDLTAAEIDKHMAVNVRASLLLIKEFITHHDGRKGGRIILLTSGQDLGPQNDELAYIASKGALHQITQSLSDIVIEKGITVNTINPGPTETYTPEEEINEAVLKRMPQKRWGQPDDAGRIISWLVSDDGQWITGQVINSEGGFRRG
jgi:3-oxoacyl-[acyl-carrier protein] reductase